MKYLINSFSQQLLSIVQIDSCPTNSFHFKENQIMTVRGQLFYLMGASGAGKDSLIRYAQL